MNADGGRGGARRIWLITAPMVVGTSHFIPSRECRKGDHVVVMRPGGGAIDAITEVTGGKGGERSVEVMLEPRLVLGAPETGDLGALERLAAASGERDLVHQQLGSVLADALDRAYPTKAPAARALLGFSDSSELVPDEFRAELDDDARELYRLAARIGGRAPGTDVAPDVANLSFTTVAAALFHVRGATGEWFRSDPPIDEALVLADLGLDPTTVTSAIGAPLVRRKLDFTRSARQVLMSARDWRQRAGATAIGVHHILASYFVSPPPNHRADLARWRFDETAWKPRFYSFVARFAAEAWNAQVTLPTPAAPATEADVPPEGFTFDSLALPLGTAKAALDLAFRLHPQRRDRTKAWLGSSIIGVALARLPETKPGDAAIARQLKPLIDALANNPKLAISIAEHFSTTDLGEPAAQPPPLSPNAVNLLERARALAEVTAPDKQIDCDHLLAALACELVRGTANILDDWLDVIALRASVVANVQHDKYRWADLLLRRQIVSRRAALVSDDPLVNTRNDAGWSNDPFNRKQDARSLALLVSDPSLEPPFAVGVFGPWGAGKTTFMLRLEDEIETITDDIVHVRFNAWHYTEANLHACLMEAILRRIGDHLDGRVGEVAAILRSLEQSQVAIQQATTREEGLATAREALRTELARERETAATVRERERAEASKQAAADVVVAMALGSQPRPPEQMKREEKRLTTEVAALRSVGRFLVALVSSWQYVVATLAVGALSVALYAAAGQIAASFGGASGAFVVLGHLYARAKRADEAWRARTTERLAASPAVRAAEARVAHTASELAAIEAQHADAVAAKSSASEAGRKASIRGMITDFVAKRVAVYGSELGLVSKIREDLETLDAVMSAGRLTHDRSVQRIVLYVDDLDRCPPERVVDVLQATHMLLAFNLFVVVIGVDATWAMRSIELKYKWLADTTRHAATPEEYLEKFFQLVLWLEPPGAASIAMYLGELQASRSPSTARRPTNISSSSPPTAPPAPSAPRTPAKLAIAPSAVELTDFEMDFLRSIARDLDGPPRRLKRLINTYRFVKSGLEDQELASFLSDSGQSGAYQSVLALLAIVTGAPRAAPRVLDGVMRREIGERVEACTGALVGLAGGDGDCVRRILETYRMTKSNEVTIDELRRWAPRIAQFTLAGPKVSSSASPAN